MHVSAVAAAIIALVLAVDASAQQDARQDALVSGADEAADPSASLIADLIAEHASAELGRVESYLAFRPRFETLAEAHRGTDAEVQAQLWLLKNTWWLREGGEMESTALPIAEDLLARHADSPRLDMLIEQQYVFTKEQREELFTRVLELSPHRAVQAAAHYGLAKLSPARGDDGEPNAHFARLLDEYADARWRQTTYGRIADAHVSPFTAEQLGVGELAPEIEGVDQDGKPMKLSDHRGKVVLLDFWGDW